MSALVHAEPAQSEPAQSEPARSEPALSESALSESAHSESAPVHPGLAPLFATIDVAWEDGVTHIALNRPHRRNAINLQLAKDLLAASLLERTLNSRCVLLTGVGEHFCVGGDLKSFRRHANLPEHLLEVTSYLHPALTRLSSMAAPLVIAARGHVAGAGLGLACFADVLVTESDATFRTAYQALGLSPDAGVSHLLPQLVGLRRAQRMTLLGHVMTAEESLDWGFSTELAAPGTGIDRAREIAAALATGPTRAFGETDRLLRSAPRRSVADQLDDEGFTLRATASGPDAAEGIAAFLERRPARFGGSR